MAQEFDAMITGLSNALTQYVGLGAQDAMQQKQEERQLNQRKDLMQFEQSMQGKVSESMAEQLVPGGGQIVTEFIKENGRPPTYQEAKGYLDSLGQSVGQRRPYYTVLGYDDKAGGYVTHNAADNTFEVKSMGRMIGKIKPNIPASEAEWFSKAETLAQTMDQVNNLYKDSFVGPIAGRVGRAKDLYTPFGDAERSKFRNLVAKGFNNIIYLRSGKQINQEEAVRLAEEFMSQNNTPVAFKSAWDSMAKELSTLASERQAALEGTGFAKAENLSGKGQLKSKPLSGQQKTEAPVQSKGGWSIKRK